MIGKNCHYHVELTVVMFSTKRLSAHDCLRHEYFFTTPLPAHHSELPLPVSKERRIRPELADLDRPIGRVHDTDGLDQSLKLVHLALLSTTTL